MDHRLNNLRRAFVLAALAGAAAGCGIGDAPDERGVPVAARDVAQPDGWDADLRMPEAPDLAPDPAVLEIELEAKVANLEILPGTTTEAWTYNGMLPGPLIRAKVGDRLIVHFRNSLPEATTIHWHGLRVPNDMDGAPGVTQPPVASGGEFRYEFVLRDAGTYWYHPHIDSAAQVGRGLYGAIVVEDPAEPFFGDELVLLLSDMSLDEDGVLLAPDSGGAFGDLFGREGSPVLVNGKVQPTLGVRTGKPQRWRVINAARARYFNVRLRDHRFIRLGGENGLAARSADVHALVLAPGERADAVFTPVDPPGTENVMRWMPTDRGYGSTFARPSVDMLKIVTAADPAVVPEPVPERLRDIDPIDTTGAPERTIALTIALDRQGVEMGINGVPHWKAEPVDVQLGATEIWNIVNDSDFAHPFHLHGYFFQVLDDARVPEWRDTVNVASKESLRIAVRFDERPGVWMFHCHILDHAEVGMMGTLRVIDPNAAPAPVAPSHHHSGYE